jgi:hypothetical protein
VVGGYPIKIKMRPFKTQISVAKINQQHKNYSKEFQLDALITKKKNFKTKKKCHASWAGLTLKNANWVKNWHS